jgi:DUF4097 and DUF4098 domain-containing protein YvlB
VGTERASFDLPVAVTLHLQSRSGKVHVVAEPRDDVEVEGSRIDAREEDGGATLRIRAGHGTSLLRVRCPAGTDIAVGTHSGSIKMEGEFGKVSVTSMSGSIELDRADETDLRTMSGSVTVAACAGVCRMSSMSGKVIGGRLDSAYAQSKSGSIHLEHVDGGVKARTVSGSIVVSAGGEGPIAVKTVSGSVRIELPHGTEPRVHFRTHGRKRCGFPDGDDVLVEAMSLSGSIEVVPP